MQPLVPNVKAITFTWLLLTLFLYRYIVKHLFLRVIFPCGISRTVHYEV